ncbi:MAG: nonstructural protein [Arizlama microvirus]|nr:MAG: nonstructural protein [Arizlama microvirus]
MQNEIFSIYDTKAQSFHKPYYSQNTQTAIREATEAAKNPDSLLSRYPEDFNLFRLGVFDQHTGIITLETAPLSIGVLNSFIKTSPSISTQ